ncbi:hypothetical protein A0H81_06663 [Grifola frondosa]|uniref:F-box domain-containing protein n=1 Tax=Grifola frondosa TaxID=5627 RepID=A0A1C7M944_GRIFR|nr:hypothetical protein A0H81_06663 [Grifola frondosa]
MVDSPKWRNDKRIASTLRRLIMPALPSTIPNTSFTRGVNAIPLSLPLGVIMPRVEELTNTHSKLPPELTDRVIDHLHDDARSLRACALVCRAWLPRARYHLFHDISLSLSHGRHKLRFERFDRLLECYPHLGYFVRKLSMRGSSSSLPQKSYSRTLARMPNVTNIIWTEAFFHPSAAFDRFKYLTGLHLENYGFPSLNDFASLICSLSHLEELSCTSVRAAECTSIVTPFLFSPLPSLRRLHFDNVVMSHIMFTRWISTNSMHTHLDSLTLLSILPDHLSAWIVLVKSAGPSLRRFAVSPQHPHVLGTLLRIDRLDLSPCTQLQSLGFGDRDFDFDTLTALREFFCGRIPDSIQEVIVSVTDVNKFLKFESVVGWNRFIEVLLLEKYLYFGRFVISVLTRTAALDDHGVALIKERFMEFYSMGRLEVEICGNKVV